MFFFIYYVFLISKKILLKQTKIIWMLKERVASKKDYCAKKNNLFLQYMKKFIKLFYI